MPETASSPASTLSTIVDYLRWGASRLGAAGLSYGHGTYSATDEAWYLLRWVLSLPHEVPPAWLSARLLPEEAERVVALIDERVRSRKPAAYLTGEAFFCGLRFKVDERVIVPRSPVAELILQGFAPWLTREPERILDLCAGSGCIAIACAHAFDSAQVSAVELDAGAFAVLQENIALHEAESRVEALQGDLFAPVGEKAFDLIVSNPPYVPEGEWAGLPAEYHCEPRMALASGADGMEIVTRILAEAPRHLTEDGLLVGEIGESRAEFDARFPGFPGIWPDLEQEGDGVFVITRRELVAWQDGRGAVAGGV